MRNSNAHNLRFGVVIWFLFLVILFGTTVLTIKSILIMIFLMNIYRSYARISIFQKTMNQGPVSWSVAILTSWLKERTLMLKFFEQRSLMKKDMLLVVTKASMEKYKKKQTAILGLQPLRR